MSFWPVRGGPVIVDGVVYFGAGVWWVFGVFLHAFDAETGKAKWTNGELGYLAHVRRDHEQFVDHAGLSPQGYLVATGDRLVVPCGRSMPAGLDLATGKLFYVLSQIWRAALSAYDAYTGRFLWRQEIKWSGYGENRHTRFVALADGLYLAVGGRCHVFDPETGRPVDTFTFNASRRDDRERPARGRRRDPGRLQRRAEKGHEWGSLLERGLLRGFHARLPGPQDRPRTVAPRGVAPVQGVRDRDGCRAGLLRRFRHRHRAPARPTARRKSPPRSWPWMPARGKEVWSRTAVYPAEALRDSQEWVAYSAPTGLLLTGRGRFGNGYTAQTGQPIWEQKEVGNCAHDPARNDVHESQRRVLRLGDGTKTGKSVDLSDVGCNYTVGSKHLLMALKRSAWYADADQARNYYLRNVRSGCLNSLLAADGLVNVQNFNADCVCNFPLQTSFALAPMPECAAWAGTTPLPVAPPPAHPAPAPTSQQD